MNEWSNWAIGVFLVVGCLGLLHIIFIFIFAIGGFFDLRHLLSELKKAVVDETDDGRVIE